MILHSENPIRMVRELKGAPLSIFIALGMVKQRVSLDWLIEVTGYTDKPLRTGLRYLREVGLVDETQSGWQLVKDNARQLPLTMQLPGENPEPQSGPDEKENAIRNNSVSLNYLNTVVVEDILINNNSTSTDLNLSDKDGKNPTLDEIQKVLDAAEGLFGHSIMGEPREYLDIDRLIAWIAKAHDGYKKSDKSKVFNPAGLVYWAFHKGKDIQPEKKYLDADQVGKYLPESFQRASGQWKFEEDGDG